MILWSHYWNYRITSFCTSKQIRSCNTPRKNLDKILKLKTYIQKEFPKCKITISTPIKRHDHGQASLTISHSSKKFKDLSISVVDNSNIRAFYLNNGGAHHNEKYLGRLAIDLKLSIRKLWCESEPVNNDCDKEMLESKESNQWIFNLT